MMQSLVGFGGKNKAYYANGGDMLSFAVEKKYVSTKPGFEAMRLKKMGDGCSEDEYVEAYGNVRPFECEQYGEVRFRVSDYSKVGEHKQFGLEIGGVQIGQTFKESAASLRDYVRLIVNHYNRVKGVRAENYGNIVKLRLAEGCGACGQSVGIVKGGYNIVNKNKPDLFKYKVGDINYPGRKGYVLELEDYKEGNVLNVGGKTYTIKAGDEKEAILNRFYDESGMIYTSFTAAVPSVSAVAGSRLVLNESSPDVTVLYEYSDANFDYYKIKVDAFEEGNIIQIGGISKTVLATDTEASIKAHFESNGFYRVASGTLVTKSVLAGIKRIVNTNEPQLRIRLVDGDVPRVKQRYSVLVGQDIKAGNVYKVEDKIVVATDGDTMDSIGRKLGGESKNILVDIELGEVLFAAAEPGFVYGEGDKAEVVTITDKVVCCKKEYYVADIELPNEEGTYYIETIAADGHSYLSNRIEVGKKAGLEVKYSNDSDAFGLVCDKAEIFSIRLPIFLDLPEFISTETAIENINGYVERGRVEITHKQAFSVAAIDTATHEYIMKVLKSKLLEIEGKNYVFEGDYTLGERSGTFDSRMASGILLCTDVYLSNSSNVC